MALEVLAVRTPDRPTLTALRELHRSRTGRRATPVLVVATWGEDRASIFGPLESAPQYLENVGLEQVDRICAHALDARDRHAAIRYLHRSLPQLAAPIPGLRNEGLFALQELKEGVPDYPGWEEARAKAERARLARQRDLLQALGFELEETAGPTVILRSNRTRTALAVLLDRPDEIETASELYDGQSPAAFALSQADRENVGYAVVSAGAVLRVYPTNPGVGTGRRGSTETFIEVNLDLLPPDEAPYLWLLFSADALGRDGSFEQILKRSEDYAAKLGGRLRERVYRDVVPLLAEGVVEAAPRPPTTQGDLDEAYQLALRILFRLLFVAYAEDNELLPLHHSATYREHSLKRMAHRLYEARRRDVAWGEEEFYWAEVRQLWKAVEKGHPEWGIPRYNGGLFSSDPETSPLGARLNELSLPDQIFAPALERLLVDETEEGTEGPVDFRALGVREFGTIYEGLLESELSIADRDLTVRSLKEEEVYHPAGDDDEVVVREGEPYLHNRSGARKSTGSYYTKTFAVDHLLDRALEPALNEHLERLDGLGEREAGRRFFEFRVADIAMGSGHFLVAAIDHIERRLRNYLSERPLGEVRDELARLRRTAEEALGDTWPGEPIEDSQLLRRQIARRCIFGVDLNPLAVELARLSVWIHTFVPGLPLSLLDHNLIQGNALVGIATFDEASELLQTESGSLFSLVAAERLGRLREPLERLGRLTDANDAEIQEARRLYREMREAIRGEAELFTILAASRTNEEIRKAIEQGQVATDDRAEGDALHAGWLARAERELEGLDVLHFPIGFPHVFLGARRGFDVILGNPPWDEATLEEDAFWARHFPGLRALPQHEQEALKAQYREERPDLVGRFEREKEEQESLREVLVAGRYPGMGTGDPDLYKAFVWRFWQLVSRQGGRIGVVLPRSAMMAKGSAEFRKELLERAEEVDVTMLLNNRKWVFPEVHPQYTIGLVAITRREDVEESELLLSGPYASLPAFKAGKVKEPTTFYGSEVEEWNDTASFPLLPGADSVEIFAQLRRTPRLDHDDGETWHARPYRELDATNDKKHMDVDSTEAPDGFWPVFKGESFDLWAPDTGTYYGWADPEVMIPVLQGKRERARTAFDGFDDDWKADPATLPCHRPRVAFRDISRSTDTRTMRAALVPPQVFLTNQAPFFLLPRGDERDEAYLLGVLSSIPLDWYARRYVETHVNYYILNPFPVPRPGREDPLWQRVVEIAGRLAAPDDRFAEWAGAVGVEHGPLPRDEKQGLVHELDALVASLYGLSEAQLVHIFKTFHRGWDYQDRLDSTLRCFHRVGRAA